MLQSHVQAYLDKKFELFYFHQRTILLFSLPTGLNKWDKKATDVLADQHMMALPTFRSQINHILMKEKNTDFKGYMHELHTVGQQASKRSDIPNVDMENAAKELHNIKRVCPSLLHFHYYKHILCLQNHYKT